MEGCAEEDGGGGRLQKEMVEDQWEGYRREWRRWELRLTAQWEYAVGGGGTSGE